MPSKKRITRDAIIRTAVDILREEGYEKVNARSIAARLNCSTQPIYSEFANMDELKAELKKEAEKRYATIVEEYTQNSEYTAYIAFGLGFIRFAKDEKQLFRYLYMRDRHSKSMLIEDVHLPKIIKVLTEQYGFSEKTAVSLHYDMTIYAYGLAVILNTNYLDMSEKQIMDRLRTEYVALSCAYRRQ